MNDPLTWISLLIAILLGLPNAIDGYVKADGIASRLRTGCPDTTNSNE